MQSHSEETNLQRRFVWALILTGGILIVEIVGGLWSGSLALLSDAGHVFVDAFALALSYIAIRFSSRPADSQHTYGFHRMEVLAALVNGALLIIIVVEILREAWHRWQQPVNIKSTEMLIIAVIGLAVNIVVAIVLGGHHHAHDEEHDHESSSTERNLNVQSAYLHVIGDAAASVSVILAAAAIALTNWTWLDPLVSVLISLLIAVSAWRVLREAFHILMEGTPRGVSLEAITQGITAIPGVESVHDLHVWSLCPDNIALSAHIVADPHVQPDALIAAINSWLYDHAGISHTTLQIENSPCGQGEVNLPTSAQPPHEENEH